MKYCLIAICAFFLFSCGSSINSAKNISNTDSPSVIVPLGGNTWSKNANRELTNKGIQNWQSENSFDTCVRTQTPGTLELKLKAKADSKSELSISVNGINKKVEVDAGEWKWYSAGKWNIKDTGYLKITLSGLSKTGNTYAEISEYQLGGTAINSQTAFVKSNEENFFYWGRRGPSVHMSYPFGSDIDAEWFYNEITVPQGEDVIGSYYMANGFAEGYFGIQVNSATERRVLFSVWSPFNTDNPKEIPADQRIEMLKKGEGVNTGEFGNEGSGGQSFLRYNWIAGNTYRFLLNGYPDGNGNTIYTAYFFAPEKDEWKLIASFKRPLTNTYLKRFHSFLENFSPDQGDKERQVLFGNQWIRDKHGKWHELNRGTFTYDNTAAKGYRKDYAGGILNGQFFLRNCGFFNNYTPYQSVFIRPLTNRIPDVQSVVQP
ncbi:MAG: DUF3472 domain-containing protein [Ginsengibacter sp.]